MNFRKLLRFVAPAAALFGLGTPALAKDAAFDRSDADPALWVLSDNDTTIYLFGTMHALKPDLVWFDDAVSEAFARSDELVLEMLDPDPAQIGPVLAREAMYGPGEGLSKALSPDQYARLTAAVAGIGIPATALEQMKPWFAGVTLAMAPLAKLGYLPDHGVENVLQRSAAEAKMPMIGLETFEQQMGFFSGLSEEDQIEFLMSGVDDMPEFAAMIGKMERAWATGDTEATVELFYDGLDDTPAVYDVLLKQRNSAWADWIEQRMAAPGTVFVAVGAGHLAGDSSVQAMLAAKGMTATRLEY